MITTFFLASNIAGLVGGIIGFILVLIIVAFVCCITVVAIGKKYKRQNVRSDNTQQVELQTIRSPETTQRTNQTGLSRPIPTTTLNTIPQRQNQYPGYETESAHYSETNYRPPPCYNESSNTIGPEEPTVVPYPYLGPYRQKTPPLYQQQSSHDLTQQPPSSSSLQPPALEEPNEKVKTLKTPPPPSYADLYKT